MTTRLPTGFRNCSLLEIGIANGLTGVGEAYLGVFAPHVFIAIVDLIREVVIGRDLSEHSDIVRDVSLATGYWSAQGAARHVVSAIEIALWDARAKAEGLPVFALLTKADPLPFGLYGSGGSVARPCDVAGELDELLALGIRTIKIRSRAHQASHAGEIMRYAKRSGIDVAVDMTQNLALPSQTVDEALTFLDELERDGGTLPVFLEEPFGPDRLEQFAELRVRTSVRIAGGEIITTPADFAAMINAGSYDICQPDATVVGGISSTLAVANHAVRKNVETVVHAWGGGVSLMANYHCAFAAAATLAEYPIPLFPLRELLLSEPLTIRGGKLYPPKAPGLGVTLSPELEREFAFREDARYRGLLA